MSEETERMQLELRLLQAREREQARQAREARFEQDRLDRAEARAKREARFEAAEQRRRDKAFAGTPEGKVAAKKAFLAKWYADHIKEGWRYVLCWGHKGAHMMLVEPPIPLAYRDRVTPELTAAERAMTYDDFMEMVGPGWKDLPK